MALPYKGVVGSMGSAHTGVNTGVAEGLFFYAEHRRLGVHIRLGGPLVNGRAIRHTTNPPWGGDEMLGLMPAVIKRFSLYVYV
jgi:hypothetical protein